MDAGEIVTRKILHTKFVVVFLPHRLPSRHTPQLLPSRSLFSRTFPRRLQASENGNAPSTSASDPPQPGLDFVTFTFIVDDIVLPTGVTKMKTLGGGGSQYVPNWTQAPTLIRFIDSLKSLFSKEGWKIVSLCPRPHSCPLTLFHTPSFNLTHTTELFGVISSQQAHKIRKWAFPQAWYVPLPSGNNLRILYLSLDSTLNQYHITCTYRVTTSTVSMETVCSTCSRSVSTHLLSSPSKASRHPGLGNCLKKTVYARKCGGCPSPMSYGRC